MLVATGSLYKVDPLRVVCKRVVLSGHPLKINKRSAVVRYMFFNRGGPLTLTCGPRLLTHKCFSLIDDILWFKPVELRTKYGRSGHIKEPLGQCFADHSFIAVTVLCLGLQAPMGT